MFDGLRMFAARLMYVASTPSKSLGSVVSRTHAAHAEGNQERASRVLLAGASRRRWQKKAVRESNNSRWSCSIFLESREDRTPEKGHTSKGPLHLVCYVHTTKDEPRHRRFHDRIVGDEPEHSDRTTPEFYVARVAYQAYLEYQKQLLLEIDGE